MPVPWPRDAGCGWGKNKCFFWTSNWAEPWPNLKSQKELSILQRNLVVSHATGVGKDLSIPVVRLAMILKLNTLAQGYSGVPEELVNIFCEFQNR